MNLFRGLKVGVLQEQPAQHTGKLRSTLLRTTGLPQCMVAVKRMVVVKRVRVNVFCITGQP